MLKIDQAIALSDLGQLLPTAVFETYPSGEGVVSENLFFNNYGCMWCNSDILNLFFFSFVSVYLEGLYCSAFEFISSEIEQTKLLSLLILEIKDKQLVSPCLLGIKSMILSTIEKWSLIIQFILNCFNLW